jgi:hypothetical protein
MKNLKKALLSTAVLAGLAAGNAYAGTEACFETFKGADNVLTNGNVNTLYASASCKDGAGVRNANLAPLASGAIAYELTGGTLGLDVNFDQLDGVDTDIQIVYVPTTDIPPGTLLEFTLTNATFGSGNANQLHLIKDSDLAGANLDFTAVASSDGAVTGQSTIKFITKAGITIGAGTRLVLSTVSTAATANDIAPVFINVKNTECTSDQKKSVTIATTKAVTDGGTGYSIDGAISKEAHKVLDISAQFLAFVGSNTVNGQVNAESKDFDGNNITARTEFVYDTAANAGLVLRKAELVHKAGFANRGVVGVLDRFVPVAGAGNLELSFVETADAGASVQAGIYNTRAAGGVLGSQVDLNGATAGNFLPFQSAKPATAQVALPTAAVFGLVEDAGNSETGNKAAFVTANTFEANAIYNEHFVTVSQTDLTKIMNFNYDVNVHAKLNLTNANHLDYCDVTKNTHKVGVNGAVLKVPYTVAGTGNFVRITNEHTVAAEVTVDLFSETADGTTGARSVTAVKLANVPAKSSVVYYVPEIVTEAVNQKAYVGSDGNTVNGANVRHSLTFTVTSPKNTVHGVSVQKLITGQDRVMPVLDTNDWTQ